MSLISVRALAFTIAGFSLGAAAQTPVSTSASVTNLGFQVIDLAPSDGIAATFKMNNPTSVSGAIGARDSHNDTLYPGLSGYGTSLATKLLPTENKSLSLLDGQVGVSANVNGDLSATMDLSTTKANTLLANKNIGVPRTRLPSETIEGSVWNISRGAIGPSATNWTLSANSSVLVKARISLSVDFDTSVLDPVALAGIYSATLEGTARGAFAVMSNASNIVVSYGSSSNTGGYANIEYNLRHSIDVASSGVLRDQTWVDGQELLGGGAPAAYRDIEFTITNNSASSVSGSLLYLAEGTSKMVLSVPEPGTWATFALGLGFLGVAVARQRKARA